MYTKDDILCLIIPFQSDCCTLVVISDKLKGGLEEKGPV